MGARTHMLVSGVVLLALAGPPSPAVGQEGAAPSAAPTVLDDRSLRADGPWQDVRDRRAHADTLSRSTRAGATLATRTPAQGAGSVELQAGPGRGSARISVGGKVVRTVKTASAKVRTLRVAFTGSGVVAVEVAKPGRRGVYVDAVRLERGSSPIAAGALTQVDTGPAGGADGAANGFAALSPDGRYLAFWSRATNLVDGVQDGRWHVYVKVLSGSGAGQVLLADASAEGAVSNDDVTSPESRALAWKPDGSELLFTSYATNLTAGPPAGTAPYLLTKSVTDGSVGQIADVVSGGASWSPNGRWIAWSSEWNPVGRQWTSTPQIYAYDLVGDRLVAVSADANGAVPNADYTTSQSPQWSPDSTRIVFESAAPSLVPGDTNSSTDVFVKTISSGAIRRVSVAADGSQAADGGASPVWSPSGDRIAFDSRSDDLVAGDANSSRDVFVKDLGSGKVTAVSVNPAGRFVVGDSQVPIWSPDGRRIAFETEASLSARPDADVNLLQDVYVRDLAARRTQLVSVRADGRTGNGSSQLWGFYGNTASWAPDGRALYFFSVASNFVAGDTNAGETSIFRKAL